MTNAIPIGLLPHICKSSMTNPGFINICESSVAIVGIENV